MIQTYNTHTIYSISQLSTLAHFPIDPQSLVERMFAMLAVVDWTFLRSTDIDFEEQLDISDYLANSCLLIIVIVGTASMTLAMMELLRNAISEHTFFVQAFRLRLGSKIVAAPRTSELNHVALCSVRLGMVFRCCARTVSGSQILCISTRRQLMSPSLGQQGHWIFTHHYS